MRRLLTVLLTSALFVLLSGQLFFSLHPGLVSGSAIRSPDAETFQAIGQNADWQPQDYHDSQGIASVALDIEENRLVLQARLVGGDPNYANGEAFLDMRYYPGLEGRVPLDLSHSEITVKVDVPQGFVGWSSPLNGASIVVKDAQWRSQNSTWVNAESGGRYTLTLRPTTGQIPGGYTTPGFDPTKIRIIGIKFGIGAGSTARYSGPLYVASLDVTPTITRTPPPPLPQSTVFPLFRTSAAVEARSDGFYYLDKKLFVVGGNAQLLEYGQNFGTTAWFPSGNGLSKHPNFVRANFDTYRRAGIKVVRVGLLDDGRTLFDQSGRVVGYNDAFRADVRTLLDLAQQANIKVGFTLLDYLIAGKPELVEGVWLRGRPRVVTDPDTRAAFIRDMLVPFLSEFGSHGAFTSMDCVNEPEWLVSRQEGGDWEGVEDQATKALAPLPVAALRAFVADCVSAVRGQAPGKLVTVGVSAKFIPLVRDLDVDYYALHYYPWMGDLRDYLPLLPAGKAWSLEEYPTASTAVTVSGHLNLALDNGGSGALLWNLRPGTDPFSFPHEERDAKLLELRTWVDDHMSIIYTVYRTFLSTVVRDLPQ